MRLGGVRLRGWGRLRDFPPLPATRAGRGATQVGCNQLPIRHFLPDRRQAGFVTRLTDRPLRQLRPLHTTGGPVTML